MIAIFRGFPSRAFLVFLNQRFMGDDLIVVDDENESGPSASVHAADSPSLHAGSRPKTVAERSIGPSSSRLRKSTTPSPLSMDNSERTTRSSNTKSKPQPKLKLKLSDKAASQAPGTSFLGQYDRELDSDDEDLAFEEQFILRMPPGEDCDKLKKAIASREVADDVWFKFKGACMDSPKNHHFSLFYSIILDSRRAVFHVGNSLYSAKLVDLPCILESQKTLDNKQMFKVADICQVAIALPLLIDGYSKVI